MCAVLWQWENEPRPRHGYAAPRWGADLTLPRYSIGCMPQSREGWLVMWSAIRVEPAPSQPASTGSSLQLYSARGSKETWAWCPRSNTRHALVCQIDKWSCSRPRLLLALGLDIQAERGTRAQMQRVRLQAASRLSAHLEFTIQILYSIFLALSLLILTKSITSNSLCLWYKIRIRIRTFFQKKNVVGRK